MYNNFIDQITKTNSDLLLKNQETDDDRHDVTIKKPMIMSTNELKHSTL